MVKREEITKLSEIERKEQVENVYEMIEGTLTLRKEPYVMDWTKDRYAEVIAELQELYDRGGTIMGAFDGEILVGIVSLENRFIGKNNDQLQLTLLQVSRQYRGKGIGRKLMDHAKSIASELGAGKLYLTASRSQNTVDFYMNNGCKLASEIDKGLFELEPVDIHLDLNLMQ